MLTSRHRGQGDTTGFGARERTKNVRRVGKAPGNVIAGSFSALSMNSVQPCDSYNPATVEGTAVMPLSVEPLSALAEKFVTANAPDTGKPAPVARPKLTVANSPR